MDGTTVKHKVTVAKLTAPYSSASRPPSRNGIPSRPASPTKSVISSNSQLASTSTSTTTRPKAKVNSSAIRRTPSTAHSDSPIHTTRPSSPAKSSRRDGALSPPTSTVGIGTRTKPVVRLKASASISSTASSSSKAKSPSPELCARSLTSSSHALQPNPAANSRKRQGSVASALHHASSSPSLQAPPSTTNVSPIPPLPPGARRHRVTRSDLGTLVAVVSSDVEGRIAGDSAPPPLKIRSRVSTLARNSNDASNSPSASLAPELSASPLPSPTTFTRPQAVRVRAGSVSSNVSSHGTSTSSPASTFPAYPITTTVPAANPHRYVTTRASPSTNATGLRSTFSASDASPKSAPDEFRPFAKTSIFPHSPVSSQFIINGVGSNGFPYGSYGRSTAAGISSSTSVGSIDPVNVPLPPQSPPMSSLSVSSRSSYGVNVSYDSATSNESSVISTRGGMARAGLKNKEDPSPQSLRTTLDMLVAYANAKEDYPTILADGSMAEEDEERKVKAEAKSNRKIADLEITNRSLLAINASLEKTKDRQAKEIRELKRKLRESRLILPPRTYRAVKSSQDPGDIDDDEEDVDSDSSSSSGDEFHHSTGAALGGDSKGTGTAAGGWKGKSDETYRRVKLMIENLLETGKKALEMTKEDFMDAKGNTKVLTAEEVESWRDSGAGSSTTIGRLSDALDDSILDLDDDNDDDRFSGRLTRSHSPTPQPVTRDGSVIGFGLRHSNFMSSASSTKPLLSSPKPPPILITETP